MKNYNICKRETLQPCLSVNGSLCLHVLVLMKMTMSNRAKMTSCLSLYAFILMSDGL